MRVLADENMPREAVEALRAAGRDMTWMRVAGSPSMPSRSPHPFVCLLVALATASAGCDRLEALLGDPDPPPAVGLDPALAPPEAEPMEPAPVVPEAEAQAEPSPTNGLELPGLPGLRLPLPVPDPNARPPEPPVRGSLAAAPAGSWERSGALDRTFQRQRARAVVEALRASLWERERQQVQGIPFEVLEQPTQPNAGAGCTRGARAPVMMITSGMLELLAGVAASRAYDELAGTETYERYVTQVIDAARSGRAVPALPGDSQTPPHATDPHKLARQVHLFDQQVAFIMGHELAHHYRGHTDCVAGRTESEMRHDELVRQLAQTAPPFGQPREIEADLWGVSNVLEAGHRRVGGRWTEEGALLNLDFFRRLSDRGGAELLEAFFSTHPPPRLRIPLVQSVAQQWEPGRRPPAVPRGEGSTGVDTPIGRLPLPMDPNQLPMDPSQLPIDPSQLPFPFPRRPPAD